MHSHGNHDADAVCTAVTEAITEAIPGAQVEVVGGGGHYVIDVVSPIFADLNRLNRKRKVLSAIKHLMAGDHAPVHAVDKLTTRTA